MRKLLGIVALMAVMPIAVPSRTSAVPNDRFGGWTGLHGRRTGYFHAQKIDDQWWLVTPDGNAFISKGVCNISFYADEAQGLGYSPYNRAVVAKYGSENAWAKATVARLRNWGLNTAGAWSSSSIGATGFPYTPVLSTAASGNTDLWLTGSFPDVFDPAFRAGLDKTAQSACASAKNDPWLIGYFTDNELRWGPDWRTRETLLESYLRLPEKSPGRKEASAFLKKCGAKEDDLTAKMKADFQGKVARTYFKLCRDAIRKYDRNHMIMGCRFAEYSPDPVLRAMKGLVDVCSINDYVRTPYAVGLRRASELTNCPVMITEFSFKAKDSGLPNTEGAGSPVDTQFDRAELYDAYVAVLATLPFCVGYHWFEYCDEPKEGRFDGENSNYGLVKINDDPWELLTERFKQVNSMMESMRCER